ncbi:MAG TPA: flagellar hook-basal body complex protein FliE [Campylobacterales bacterium]|nr:flagellar hook-basal body complex protein FliE [Campylobacterales bacterium]
MKISSISNEFVPFDKSLQNLTPTKDFDEILKEFIADVNNDLKSAGAAKDRLISANVSNLEEIMAQIAKADISLRLITEIRNKALESYQEIMRMQV